MLKVKGKTNILSAESKLRIYDLLVEPSNQ